MEEGGLLFCRGRMDDQIKLNGYRIELAEIDEALHGLPGAEGGACAVLRRPDGTAVRLIGFVTGAAVAGEQPAFLDAQALSNWKDLLAQRLPPYMVPSELVACPAHVEQPQDRPQEADRYLCRDTRVAAWPHAPMRVAACAGERGARHAVSSSGID